MLVYVKDFLQLLRFIHFVYNLIENNLCTYKINEISFEEMNVFQDQTFLIVNPVGIK